MTRRVVLGVGIALFIIIAACGDDDEPSNRSPDIDVTSGLTKLTLRYPAGALQQGWTATVASGDFNGDSAADLLVGLPFADGADGSRQDAGEAYVLFGPLTGAIDLATPPSSTAIVLGAEVGDHLGGGVAAGDLNGDGIDDVIVGAPASNGLVDIRTDMGEAYVIFGRQGLNGTFDILDQVQDVTIQPAEGFSTLGLAFAVGDLNDDGVDDLVTGAPYAGRQADTPPGGPRTTVGEVYVFYGGSGFAGTLTVAHDDDDLRLAGEHQYDQFGVDVTVADMNGDGMLDIVVGASGYDAKDGANGESGGVFMFYGSGDPPERRTESEADLVLEAPAAFTFGTRVATADLDSDGTPEIGASAPGAPGSTEGDLGVGSFYELVLPNSSTVDIDSCDCASVANGRAAGEFFPASLAASADGKWFALGAPAESDGRTDASGTVYLIRSAGSATPAEQTSTRVIGAEAGAGLGSSVTFADIDGDGSSELLALAVASGETAIATLYALTLRN